MSTTRGILCPTIGSALAAHAQIQPDAIAMPGTDAKHTFAELDARVNQLANALLDRELGIGDMIAWLGAPSWRMIETVLAASRLGAQLCHV